MSSVQEDFEEKFIEIIEEWRAIQFKFGLSKYEISNTGKVRYKGHIDTLKGNKPGKNGSFSVNLTTDKNIAKEIRIHHLVAYTFLENPENKPYVLHKDEDGSNNSVNNLIFSFYRTLKAEKINSLKISISKEIWKTPPVRYKLSKYEVSTEGNIRNKIKGNYLQNNNKKKNLSVNLTSNEGKTNEYIIRDLVAHTFLENSENKPYVVHKDKDIFNNNVSNLTFSTHPILEEKNIMIPEIDIRREEQRKILENLKINMKNASSKEIWKTPPGRYKLSKYEVSTYGNIRNKRKNNVNLSLNPDQSKNGYIYKMLTLDNGKQKGFYLHIVIANTFLENPENKPSVDHIISEEKSNNRIENLRFADNSEQSFNRNLKERIIPIDQYDVNGLFIQTWDSVKRVCEELNIKSHMIYKSMKNTEKTAGGFIWKKVEEVIDGEIWKKYLDDFPDTFVSNKGRVKKRSGDITRGSLNKGYLTVYIFNKNTNKYHNVFVHRMICKIFKPLDDYTGLEVNHINEIKTINTIENLEWVTGSENQNHSLNLHGRSKNNILSNIVVKIDMKTLKIIGRYKSINEAARVNKVNNTGVSHCCHFILKSAYNFYWQFEKNYQKFIDEKLYEYKIPIVKNFNKESKKVVQINIETKEIIQYFLSPTDASKKTGINRSGISRCCTSNIFSSVYQGYIWRYEDYLTTKPPVKTTYKGNLILQIDPKTNQIISKFKNPNEAAISTGFIKKGISKCYTLNSKIDTDNYKMYKGFIWKLEKIIKEDVKG